MPNLRLTCKHRITNSNPYNCSINVILTTVLLVHKLNRRRLCGHSTARRQGGLMRHHPRCRARRLAFSSAEILFDIERSCSPYEVLIWYLKPFSDNSQPQDHKYLWPQNCVISNASLFAGIPVKYSCSTSYVEIGLWGYSGNVWTTGHDTNLGPDIFMTLGSWNWIFGRF